MYLPSRYVPLLLANKGYTPKQAFDILLQVFQDDNVIQEMELIIMWLRISLHASLATNCGPPTTTIVLTAPFLDEDLVQHRAPLLNSVLPGRGDHSVGLEAAIAQMASAVVNQMAEAHTAWVARELERDQPTTPPTKFGMLLDSLKAYLDVEDEAGLPEFWFQLAAAPKQQEFSIMREFFGAFARSPQVFIPFTSIPTTKLLTDLTSITFLADHHDDLKTGLHPFIIMDSLEEHHAASLDLTRSFNLVYEHDFSVAFMDLDRFKLPKDLRSYPITFFELERNLGLFGNLLVTVLGEPHPLTTNYRLFWDAFTKQHHQLLQHKIDTRRVIKPVHILWNLQLICFHWFAAKQARLPPTPPSFPDILTRISLALYTCPTLPLPLYQLLQAKGTPLLRTTTMSGPHPAPMSSTITPDDATQASSGVSTITASIHTGTSSRAGTFVPNNNGDISLQRLVLQCLQLHAGRGQPKT
jgi:hypothetical protein